MSRRFPLAALFLAVLAVPASAQNIVPTGFSDQVVIGSGLTQPRAFAFLPDGRMLVLEQRTGNVRLIVGNHIASKNPVFTIPNVNSAGYERGAQGIAVDPQFPTRPYVYFFYDDFDLNLKLVRYTVTGAVSDPLGETLTFGTQRFVISNLYHGNQGHNGGCLRFGPDGYLYASIGDGEESCTAQDSTNGRGCFMRLDVSRIPATAGAQPPRALIIPPGGNPLVTPDSTAKLVWAYGLRNPWVFGMDPYTGTIYTSDVGESTQEEVDEILPGRNYGWPYREGFTVQPDTGCVHEPGGQGNSANGYTPPIAAFDRDDQLHAVFCSGIYRPVQPTATSKNWPAEYRGNVWYGDYYRGDLIRLVRDPSTNRWVRAAAVPGQPDSAWARGLVATTDFNVGADGSLYYLQQFNDTFGASTGSIHRIVYNGSQADVPPASVRALQLSCGPNPFRGGTDVAFTTPRAGHVTLTVHDLLGRRVATLLDGDASAGETRVRWDAAGVAPGVYLARLSAGGETRTVRMLRLN